MAFYVNLRFGAARHSLWPILTKGVEKGLRDDLAGSLVFQEVVSHAQRILSLRGCEV
jgi:hypothetical protein